MPCAVRLVSLKGGVFDIILLRFQTIITISVHINSSPCVGQNTDS